VEQAPNSGTPASSISALALGSAASLMQKA
jgi:hypothetical protein